MIWTTLYNPSWYGIMQAMTELGLQKEARVRTDFIHMTQSQFMREIVPGRGDLREGIAALLNLPVDIG